MSLHLENLNVGYGSISVINDINAKVEPGEFIILVGRNGSGKSTLLRTICGSQKPLSGRMYIDERQVSDYSPLEIAKKISIVLTGRTSAGGLTVEELVGIGRNPYSGLFGRLSQQDRHIINDSISAVGLMAKKLSYVSRLSDGERQKAMIARAIAQETDIIVLDEPTSFLDIPSRFEIMELLSGLCREKRKSIILSTHDISSAIKCSDRIWAIANHRLLNEPIEKFLQTGLFKDVFPELHFNVESNDFRCINSELNL